ncbi:toll/interleukin-1 receptor domain-containing protein [Celeribacter sp.]|uniref:toll/interleukin-1 receptor domain-containing protein n=1 Tax=Celeribacter sp. TaxID=1890673 RepID=UPI003A8FAC2B
MITVAKSKKDALAMKTDGKFYNFICSANENQWERTPSQFTRSRMLEYTDAYIPTVLEREHGSIETAITKIPTLFAYEDFVGKKAQVGYITTTTYVDEEIVIAYELDDNYLPLTTEELEELCFELEIERFELSRTHWAIKHIDLLAVMEKRGKRVPNLTQASTDTSQKTEEPQETSTPTAKKKIFVSYSHSDAKYLSRLQTHLKPLESRIEIELWADTRLVGGDDFKSEIQRNLEECSLAILLVSADFLASDFVVRYELPPLLKKHEEDGCRIVPIIVKPCIFTAIDELAKFQSLNDPKESLCSLTEAKQEEIYSKAARQVLDLFGPPPRA